MTFASLASLSLSLGALDALPSDATWLDECGAKWREPPLPGEMR